MGVITRMVRASVLEILQQDFVLTLRAKGLWVADGDAARHEECRPAGADLDGPAVWLSPGWLCARRDCV